MKQGSLLIGFAILFLLSGCSSPFAARAAEGQRLPVPTSASFLNAKTVQISPSEPGRLALATPTVAPIFGMHPTVAPLQLLPSAVGTDLPVSTITQSRMITATIFDDHLNPNWSLQAAPGMQFDQANTTHTHSGTTSIAMTAHADYSTLSFVVDQNTKINYPRSQVLGISFWLNSGNDYVNLSDLAVKVLGSNAYPYWTENDNSIPPTYKSIPSDTRLYYLGINRAIPPETWVRVIVYLDKLIYDPVYKYVTGFYIKNDAGFFRTVYIDDVDMLMVSNNTQAMNVLTSTGVALPTPSATPEPILLTPTITPTTPATKGNPIKVTPTPTIRPRPTSTSGK